MKIDFQCFKTILERLETRIKRQLVKIALLQSYEIFSDSSMTEKTCWDMSSTKLNGWYGK